MEDLRDSRLDVIGVRSGSEVEFEGDSSDPGSESGSEADFGIDLGDSKLHVLGELGGFDADCSGNSWASNADTAREFGGLWRDSVGDL